MASSSRHMFNHLIPYGLPPQNNGTTAGTANSTTTSNQNIAATIAIGVILLVLIVIFLIVIVVMSLLLPRFSHVDLAASKEERNKKRMERLNKSVSSQKFRDWRTKENAAHPDTVISAEPLCVICLETIQDRALVRGLSCHHVYHQQCLDTWYSKWHEYCPLCHRLILPTKAKKGRHTDGHATENENENTTLSTQAVAFMV